MSYHIGLGIGSPGTIESFILVGLQGEPAAPASHDFEDLNTLLIPHWQALYVAGNDDLTTLIVKEVGTVRAASNQDDLNTAYEEFLN
jgi:hypothetical protein